MKPVALAWAGLSLLLSTSLADVSSFINPPAPDATTQLDFANNPNYTIDDSINLQWNTPFVNVSLLLEQEGNDFRPVLIDNQPNPGAMDWTVSYNDFQGQLNANAMMRFRLFDAPSQNFIYSHFFNLSSPPPDVATVSSAAETPSFTIVVVPAATSSSVTPTTFATTAVVSKGTSPSSTTASASPAAMGSAFNFNAATASASNSATSPSATSSGLDASTQAGLGVGLGLGIPLVGLLGAIIFLLHRRRDKHQPTGPVWPAGTNAGPYTAMSHSPSNSFASQPQMHAVPILQPPPPTRFISHHRTLTNEDGYAPPSAKLKPWPETMMDDMETRRVDAYGRPKGPSVWHEAPGDCGYTQQNLGPCEMVGERNSMVAPKELPSLPQAPMTPNRKEEEARAAEEESRLKKLLA